MKWQKHAFAAITLATRKKAIDAKYGNAAAAAVRGRLHGTVF